MIVENDEVIMQKKVLIVGGAGFIGSLVNKLLHDQGYETVIFDDLSNGYRQRVKWGQLVEGSLGNLQSLENLFSASSFDAVMHFAGLINVGESVINPSQYYENNVTFTLQLLDVMRQWGIKNFIFSSTAAVYGIPEVKYINENHPLHPINPYGRSKWMVENILEDFDAAYGMKSIKLRYFNAAGGDPEGKIMNPFQKTSNLIPIVLQAIKNDQPVTIFGHDYPTPDGTCIRDYIHIYDLATAHIAAMEKLFQGGNSEVYNLGNGEGFSVREVIKAAEKVTGKTIQIIEGARRTGDPAYLLADAKKAQSQLQWKIKYPRLEEMIEHAWRTCDI